MKQFSTVVLMLLVAVTSCKAEPKDNIKNSLPVKKIIQTINSQKPVLVKDKIITGDLDFSKVETHYTFSSSNEVAQVKVPITFLNCIFMGKVSTTSVLEHTTFTTHFSDNVTFEACDFRGETSFDNALVDGMLNFTGAIFNERVSFNNMHIKGRYAYFTACTAEKQFRMQETLLCGTADFFKAVIKGKLSFQSTEFAGDLRVNDLKCDGKADFSLTTIRGNFMANYALFNDEFRFSNARVDGKADMVNTKFINAWINNTRFGGRVNLTNTEISKKLDLDGSIFAIKPESDGVKGVITGLPVADK